RIPQGCPGRIREAPTAMKIPFVQSHGELLRWTLSGVAIVALHGAVAAAMVNWSDEEDAAPTAAMVVDLSPFPTSAPDSVSDLPPGPVQVEAEASPNTPVTEDKEQVEERVEHSESREVQPDLAQAENPEVVLDATPPKPEQKVEIQQVQQMP